MQTQGRYFQGDTGRALGVSVTLDGAQALHIRHDALENGVVSWSLQDIRALADHALEGQIILSCFGAGAIDSAEIGEARLILSDADFIQQLRHNCPNLNKRDLSKGALRKVGAYTAGALGALALMIFVILPALANTLAQIIPIEREVAYGKTIVRQIKWLFSEDGEGPVTCSSPKGEAALAQMLTRLTAHTEISYELNVQVINHPMINAFAAPGGQIVIMNGLLKNAQTADEVAAVLGHEIGHVEARDPTRGALRATGSAGLLSLMFGDLTGGSLMAVVADYMLNASYTREAEAQADQFAFEMLDASNISTTGMADFFHDLEEGPEEDMMNIPVYFSSHPLTGERAKNASDFAAKQGKTQPVLSDQEWADLKAICQ